MLALVTLVAGLLITAVVMLRGSLPKLQGQLAVTGLTQVVTIERDERGRPVISAGNWPDLARALGFVHAQDRFFQMDLSRRAAAGELSALMGTGALELDKSRRMHRLRAVARKIIANMSSEEAALLAAYTEGVNSGLDALHARPFEYWLLQVTPQDWRPEDVLLVAFAMYFNLSDESAERDARFSTMRAVYSQTMFDFLTQNGTSWDAPMTGAARAGLAVPSAEEYSLPKKIGEATANRPVRLPGIDELSEPVYPGSNNWALHGSRTASGVALLANDMHLGLGIPNTWYYARLVIRESESDAPSLDVTGVTLPGTFGVIAGSNRKIAWGFTNSYGDWSDRVLVERNPDDPGQYLTPAGYRMFERFPESIAIKDGEPVTETYLWTIWGPVVGEDHLGRQQAVKWLAHEAQATNTRIVNIATAGSVSEALALANDVGAPPQNFVVADRRGNIGWTIMGRIPKRVGYDPRLAESWAQPGTGWQGWMDAADYPRLINPSGGQVWTANARVTDGDWLTLIGDGGYDLGARAGQIRDGLASLTEARETDMLALQLDDRALFLRRWQARLMALLDEAAVEGYPRRAELQKVVANWAPRASVDSAGFRMVRAWRIFLIDDVFKELTVEAREADPLFEFVNRQWEGAIWQLLDDRPSHLLPAQYSSWRDWQLHIIDTTIEYFDKYYPGPLDDRVWGERNRVTVRHPLSAFVPLAASWLDMPTRRLPGDNNMPRVQSPFEGASQRLAVSPGLEEHGYFHMPGGQSGHPLSKFYASEHAAWASGEAVAFLPGPAQYVLQLEPQKQR